MTGALRDATLLSDALLAAPIGSAAMTYSLSNYQTIRDKLSLPMLQITDEIASYMWDIPRARTLLRRLSSAMTDEVETLADAALSPEALPTGALTTKAPSGETTSEAGPAP
jgi:hypothetical protein